MSVILYEKQPWPVMIDLHHWQSNDGTFGLFNPNWERLQISQLIPFLLYVTYLGLCNFGFKRAWGFLRDHQTPPPLSENISLSLPTACQSSCATCSSSLDCQSCGSQLPLLSADSGQCLASCPAGSYQHDHTHCRREYRSLSHGLMHPLDAIVDAEVVFWLRFTQEHLERWNSSSPEEACNRMFVCLMCLEAEFVLRLMRLGNYRWLRWAEVVCHNSIRVVLCHSPKYSPFIYCKCHVPYRVSFIH